MQTTMHECAIGAYGTILAASCDNCGCTYHYCDSCRATEESATPDEDCRDAKCGCHTDGRHELGE